MVEFLEGKTLSKYLLDKYSKNPNGWSFTLFPPAKEDNGFFGAYVGGPDETWQLKIDSIFKPSPIMLGAKADVDAARIGNLGGSIPYGYRRLDKRVAFELLQALSESTSGNEERDRAQDRFLLERILLPLRPVAPVQGESYAEGPFVLTDRSNLAIASGQRQLEDRLSTELRKLIRNRYSSYG
jgi:hypothetical protein